MNEKDMARDKEWIRGHKPRHLFLDIETSPITAAVWNVHEADALWHKPGEILMVGYKWEGKPVKIVSQSQFWDLPKSQREKRVMRIVWDLLDEADIVTGYNGNKFDIKEINARFMKWQIKEPSPYMMVDPLLIIKKRAKFPSHKLEDIVEYFKLGKKMETGGKYLWKRFIEGDKEAQQKMEKYCMTDTVLVEKVFDYIKAWDTSSFNYNFYTRFGLACTKCGSKEFTLSGKRFLRSGIRRRYDCKKCGHQFHGPLEKENIEPVTSYG